MSEYHPHFFQAQLRRFREAEYAEEPAEKTESGVETEGTSGGDLVHEGKVGRTDQEVGGPVDSGGERRADATNYGHERDGVRYGRWAEC